VLGGGGSRGLAHAGAIAGLEEKGLHPSLIVGTSMGAIIGALYAAGLPTDSIDRLVRQGDWPELFAPARIAFGPHDDGRRPLLRLDPGLHRGRYQEGLIPDAGVNRLLVRLLLDIGARANNDFDALPRRFRAVAADLLTGGTIVIADGDLARAVRASMAVPGVFAPIDWHGRTLVDGGIADYLPVGPARDAGARRVVAVDAVRPPDDIAGISVWQVALRSFRLTLRNAQTSSDSADVLVTPDIDPDFAGAVFLRDPDPLIRAGYNAAIAEAPRFENSDGAPRQPAALPVRIEDVIIETNDASLHAITRHAFDDVTGAYDGNRILAAVDALYASGLFSGVWPRVERATGADAGGILIVRADAIPPTTVAGGVAWEVDRGPRVWAALHRRIGGPAEVALAVQAGDIDRFASVSLRRPLPFNAALDVNAGGLYTENDVRLFDAERSLRGEREVRRAGGWVGAAWRSLAPDLDVRGSLRAEYVDDGSREGVAIGPHVRFAAGQRNARIVGIPKRVEAEWRTGDFDYRAIRIGGSLDYAPTTAFLAAVIADLAVAAGAPPTDALPALGDDHALPGLRWGQQRDRTRVVAGLDLALATPLEAFIRLRLRAGATAGALDDLDRVRWPAGAELGLVWSTPLGQLSFEVGANTLGLRRAGVRVGPRF